MHLSILCPTTPLLSDVGEGVGFELYKIQMLLGIATSQSNPFYKDRDLKADLTVNVHTSSVQSSHIWWAVKFPM